MVPLYAARVSDLEPGDMVRAECSRGHDGLIHPAALTALGLRPYDRILDLAPRLRCGEGETAGRRRREVEMRVALLEIADQFDALAEAFERDHGGGGASRT